MEQTITLHVEGFELEGRLNRQPANRAAVIAHPHPLYGGDMDNSVVMCAARSYSQAGWSTLRFNFRGTGQSGGSHDDGRGEQKDLQAAVEYLIALGMQHMDLIGYSFGAVVVARWAVTHARESCRLVLISPPLAFMDFPKETPLAGLSRIIIGDLDPIAPVDAIQSMLSTWQMSDRLNVIEGADHAYFNRLRQLKEAIQGQLP